MQKQRIPSPKIRIYQSTDSDGGHTSYNPRNQTFRKFNLKEQVKSLTVRRRGTTFTSLLYNIHNAVGANNTAISHRNIVIATAITRIARRGCFYEMES
jgi:hypothetical protein